jgi:hypothetical protein
MCKIVSLRMHCFDCAAHAGLFAIRGGRRVSNNNFS